MCFKQIANAWRIYIRGHDKSAPTAACGLPKCCKQPAYNATFTPEMPNQHSVKCPHSPTKCPRTTPPGVGADSSRPYPYIIKYTYSFHCTRVFISSHTHVHIFKYVYSSHHTHISVFHFVGISIYAGTINRPLQLLVVCQNAANNLPITQHSTTKHPTNTP